MIHGHCDHALLPNGWHANVSLRADASGRWAEVVPDTPRADLPSLGRFVLPGMPNLHSHAFQRAMAGRAERYSRPDDSFWSWRETMYQHAGGMNPERLRIIARWLYTEMLEQGYTRVCEFHYVHHQADGKAYQPETAMADALVAAAGEVGIGLTLLPTLYQRGGFADQPLSPRQWRFQHATETFMRLCEALAVAHEGGGVRVGAAIHSLRAVAPPTLTELLADDFWHDRPLHIHIAEQRQEVEDCLQRHARRPIELLFDTLAVDQRFCLVHATHALPHERALMASSGAVVGICTTTEANLGDGLFELADLRARGGAWGIGSDSHIGLDPREELRWLEYQARLATGRRTVLANAGAADVGVNLWNEAVQGGSQAAGSGSGGLQVGADADWLVLDAEDAALAGCTVDQVMGSWMFGPARRPIATVGVRGREYVQAGRHRQRERFESEYRELMQAGAGLA